MLRRSLFAKTFGNKTGLGTTIHCTFPVKLETAGVRDHDRLRRLLAGPGSLTRRPTGSG